MEMTVSSGECNKRGTLFNAVGPGFQNILLLVAITYFESVPLMAQTTYTPMINRFQWTDL